MKLLKAVPSLSYIYLNPLYTLTTVQANIPLVESDHLLQLNSSLATPYHLTTDILNALNLAAPISTLTIVEQPGHETALFSRSHLSTIEVDIPITLPIT